MQGGTPSFFDGLAAEEVKQLLADRARRRFPAGTVLLAEGDSPRELYVIETGSADVVVTDRRGQEHWLNQVGPGATLGEMALFTGQPASATVRTTTEVEVLVLNEADFLRATATFPRLYRNLGAILSERLAATNRRSLPDHAYRLSLLCDHGAPPILGYALAGSVAWHTRTPTLLLLMTPDSPPDDLIRLAAARSMLGAPALDDLTAMAPGDAPPSARADLVVTTPADGFAGDDLAERVLALCDRYDHVLVQVSGDSVPRALANRVAHALRLDGPQPDGAGERRRYTISGWAPAGTGVGPDRDGVLRVPAPSPADHQALGDGLLPATTPTGRALGWAARDVTGRKVGLALGAGSVKGYAHLGVLRVLQRLGLPIDYLAGTSIGAAAAALYALGYDTDRAADTFDQIGTSAFRLAVPTTALLSSGGLRSHFRAMGGETRIEDLPLPLAILTADIMTGQEVVLREGPLWQAVLASMALPGIYPPQRIGRHTLVDGGVLNPVPVNITAEMGADTLIAVKLVSRPTPVPAERSIPKPSLIEVILRSFEIMQSYIVTDTAARATILIEPTVDAVGGWGIRRFSQGRRFIEVGEAAAEAALPRLMAALPWLRD